MSGTFRARYRNKDGEIPRLLPWTLAWLVSVAVGLFGLFALVFLVLAIVLRKRWWAWQVACWGIVVGQVVRLVLRLWALGYI